MMLFWKAAAIVILTVLLGVSIGKTEKDIALVLIAAACCAIAMLTMYTLSDVIAFLWKLSNSVGSGGSLTGILLKITGVALIAELIGLISADAGSSSLGKAMDFFGNAVILSLSLPLFESFFDIVQEILNII